MDRDMPNDPRDVAGRDLENSRSRGQEPRDYPTDEHERPEADKRSRECPLTDTERQTMAEIGRFRTLSIEDLALQRHSGDSAKMQQDIRQLSARGLVQKRSVWLGKEKDRLVVVTLTRAGKKALERSGEPGTFYAGFVKPNEMAHDAAIYRVYQAEAARIARQGGEIRRITLDYELKRKVYSPSPKKSPAHHNTRSARGKSPPSTT